MPTLAQSRLFRINLLNLVNLSVDRVIPAGQPESTLTFKLMFLGYQSS